MTGRKRTSHLLPLLLGAILFLLATASPAQPPAAGAPAALIVTLRPGSRLAKAATPVAALQRILASRLASGSVRAVVPAYPLPGPSPLQHTFVVHFNSSAAADSALQVLQAQEPFAAVQFNHILNIDQSPSPNDSLFAKQWGLRAVKAVEAWQRTLGAGVLVAIIDTGIDAGHPEFAGRLWCNPGEDVNGNDAFDLADINGIDDDANGFVDDVCGWDFTDAPNFVDGGDYLGRDNDPNDENGHGTSVAGIIGALAGNGLGIAGVAPGARLLPLRAGTSQGLLEEDDVAAAIVYAVQSGARVINMSFGDVVISPMLRDVVAWAWAQGVTLVASAGNAASAEPHYPSGLMETISVGAVAEDLARAAFSNYGSSVDLVAPGVDIWTTDLQGGYRVFSGTSAAAPFVSAIAALLLARQPVLTPEEIRSRLAFSARDLGAAGRDEQFGAGLVDAASALAAETTSIAVLHAPAMDSGLAGTAVAVTGTAGGVFLREFDLSYAPDSIPQWIEIARQTRQQVVDDTLALWHLAGVPDGVYRLRLRVTSLDGSVQSDIVRVFVDRTPPVIRQVQQTPMLDGESASALISFEVDDVSRATFLWRARGSSDSLSALPLPYVTTAHRVHLTPSLVGAEDIEYAIEAVNRAGLAARDDFQGRYYPLRFGVKPAVTLPLAEQPLQAPGGLLLPRRVDFDRDQREELLLSRYGDDFALGPLTIFEVGENGYTERFHTSGVAIPRDVGDSDRDGLLEILAARGPESFIYEQRAPNSFDFERVWRDSSDFWAARFTDLDADGRTEIAGRVGKTWQLREADGAGAFRLMATLENFTAGENAVGVPHAETGDFDGDGRRDILLGDYDGDVYIYEAAGEDQVQPAWSDRLPLLDTIDFLQAGDFDGDGTDDFAVACHSDPAFSFEHEFDARHWLVRIYSRAGDNQYAVAWEERFFGFFNPKDFAAGLGAGDLDQDGSDELLLSLFPDFYVIKAAPAAGNFAPVWHSRTARSNAALVFRPDGRQSVLAFSDGARLRHFGLLDPMIALPPPAGLDGFALSAAQVQLRWSAVSGAASYEVHRGTAPEALQEMAVTRATAFVDTSVVSGTRYYYAVLAVNPALPVVRSARSQAVAVIPAPGPRLLQVAFTAPHFLTLRFSQPLGEAAKNAANYEVDKYGLPASAVLARGRREVLLTLPGIPAGAHAVRAKNLAGTNRVPLNTEAARLEFEVPPARDSFYLVSASYLAERNEIAVVFNQPVARESAEKPAQYRLSPPVTFDAARVDAQAGSRVRLRLATQAKLQPIGKSYRLTVQGVRSANGDDLTPGMGDAVGLTVAAAKLAHVFAYPNPFLPAQHGAVMIAGLTPQAEVYVLNEMGEQIRKLVETDGDGGTVWDGRDDHGETVPSGIYLILATSGATRAMAKVAVIR